MRKRIICIIVSIILCFSLVYIPISAAEQEIFNNGEERNINELGLNVETLNLIVGQKVFFMQILCLRA